MRKIISHCLLVSCGLTLFIACQNNPSISQQELTRRTQELVDAIAVGDRTPWNKYFATDAMYSDETGKSKNKQTLLADLVPLPKGYSGAITVENVHFSLHRGTAIMSYDLNEKEAVFGQQLTARYHETDTWIRRHAEWQIVAGQIYRYYEDPAAGKAAPAKLAEYVGTYELAPGHSLTISREGAQLYRQRGNEPKVELIPEDDEIFFRKGIEGRILFRRAPNGKVDALIDRRNNEDLVWKKLL
jgi:hypothetical protein